MKSIGCLSFLVLLACTGDPTRDPSKSPSKVPSKAWDFEKDAVGQAAQGFYFDTTRDMTDGKWEVVQDGESRVLAQVDRNRSEHRFALAVVRDSSFEDVRLSVRFKAVAGEVDQTGGIVWRYRNSENYYLLRADVTEQEVRLYRVVNGNRIKFADEDATLATNQWHRLRLQHEGETIKVYLDDEMLMKARDRTFHKRGKIGLWTQADAVTYFDDLRVEDLDDDEDHLD